MHCEYQGCCRLSITRFEQRRVCVSGAARWLFVVWGEMHKNIFIQAFIFITLSISFSRLFLSCITSHLSVVLHPCVCVCVSTSLRLYFPWCGCVYCYVCVCGGRRGVAGQTDGLGLEGMRFLHRRRASTGAFRCPSVEPKTKTGFLRRPS